MDRNLPAPQHQPAEARPDLTDRAPVERNRPVSVAFLPLALVTFILLAIAMAAWTFLAAGA